MQGIGVVIQYGIVNNPTEGIQRGGRGGRDSETDALFLMMYEPWVLDLDLSGIDPMDLEDDPDRPFQCTTKKQPLKKERTGVASISMVQSSTCIRQFSANYLKDQAANGIIL
jgi:hypothetical protein